MDNDWRIKTTLYLISQFTEFSKIYDIYRNRGKGSRHYLKKITSLCIGRDSSNLILNFDLLPPSCEITENDIESLLHLIVPTKSFNLIPHS